MKKIFKLLLNLFVLFVGFLIFLTGQTVAEHIKINRDLKSFMSKAVLQEDISTDTIKYYQVSRETFYPDEFYRDAFFEDDLKIPGAEGDIFVTMQSPLPEYPGLYEFIGFYFGGHSAYVGDDGEVYDITGFFAADENLFGVILNGGEYTYVTKGYNFWLDDTYRNEDDDDPSYLKFGPYYRTEWIGIRVKGITKEEINKATSFMNMLTETKAQYNYLFIFFTKNKYYCTDMMSRAYATITNSNGKMKYNLNRDGVAVTVNDLILSKDTYISYYVRTDKNNVKHVYYIQ